MPVVPKKRPDYSSAILYWSIFVSESVKESVSQNTTHKVSIK